MADKSSTGFGVHKPLLVLSVSSTVVLLLFLSQNWSVSFDNIFQGFGRSNSTFPESCHCPSNSTEQLKDELSIAPEPKDKLLGGLLTTAFDEESCLSRYQSALYWKLSHHKPSPYLLERLRSYEALHKKCGPNSEFFKKASEQLRDFEQLKGNHSEELMECKYVIWIPDSGLGNSMISIISAFLYALLNNKVLLLAEPDDFKGLFCEPFPEGSWSLPSDFPLKYFSGFYKELTPESYATLLKKNVLSVENDTTNATLPFIYIHIKHDSNDLDRMFFCDGAQNLLRKMQWVLIRANNYYGPGFFLLPQYRDELDRLFPEKDTVFHHLARYVLHPTNSIWGRITRYYDAYLANAKLRVGIQIREFPSATATFDGRLGQVINCSIKEGLLPNVVNLNVSVNGNGSRSEDLKAVLVVSLNSGYYDRIKTMYDEHATENGELIGVYQPSHEGEQHTEKQGHNVKALADIYLLSFSDFLVTSEYSTFGSAATGLSGLKPWIVQNSNGDQPSCWHAASMEPCFMDPPRCDCKAEPIDAGAILPYLRRCEDRGKGLKLFSN